MAPPGNPAAALTAVRATTDPVAQVAQVTDDLDALIEVVSAWRDKVNSFVATGSDDDDVIATHDARGRLWGYPRLVDILTGWAMPRQERMPSWVRRGRVTPRSSVPRLRVW